MTRPELGPDHAFATRVQKMDDSTRQQATRNLLQNASIGAGGLQVSGTGGITISGGGSLFIGAGGSINLTSGTLSATHVVGTTDVVSNGDVDAAGTLVGTAGVTSPGARAFTVSSGFAGAWLDVAGRLGINPSSARYKDNILHHDMSDIVAALYVMQPVSYDRIEGGAHELGFIAEHLVELGLGMFTFNDEDGETQGIHYDRLTVALVAAVQSLNSRLEEAERKLGELN